MPAGTTQGCPPKSIGRESVAEAHRLTARSDTSSVTVGTATTTYTYDPLDRLEKIVAPAYTKVFAYVGLTNSVARITTTGSTTSVTEVANDLNGTELYEYTDPAAPGYLESNGHGDVIFTTAESGAISGNAAYDPFGNLVAGSTLTTATRWQGSYQDDSSGLYRANQCTGRIRAQADRCGRSLR